MVDFKQPGFEFVVQNDVEPKRNVSMGRMKVGVPEDLEAHVVVDVIWLRRLIIMQHNRLTTTKRLDNHFIYFLL